MKQEIICENCKGRNIKKDDGFWKMKNHEKNITTCINMYYAVMSLRKIVTILLSIDGL